MSRIDGLIRQYAPNGVEHRRLGDAGTLYNGLTGKSKADFSGGNVRYASYRNVYSNIAVDVSPADLVRVGEAERQNRVRRGDVLFTASSENLDEVGLASVVTEEPPDPLFLNSFCFGFRPTVGSELDPGFCKYMFRSLILRDQIRRTANGVTRVNISKERFREIRIPVPHPEIQREIAMILDAFTDLEAPLEANLEAELEARRQQYAHYRGGLLSFDSNVEWAALEDVVDYTNGKAHERLADPNGVIPMVTARFISRNGDANRFVRPEDVQTPANRGDIVLVLSDLPNGRALARTFFIDRDNGYAINQRVARLRVKDANRVEPRFLYHVLDRNPGLLKYDNGVDQTHLSKGQVTGLRVPVPALVEQRRIVDVLDRFDALVNDLSSGLSAEVQTRRQQYAYYRDRLLTFEEAAT